MISPPVNPRMRVFDVVDGLRRRAGHRLRFGGRYSFDDRSRGSDTLGLILAGFKEYLWPYSLTRLAELIPESADVCLLAAGGQPPAVGAAGKRNRQYDPATQTHP